MKAIQLPEWPIPSGQQAGLGNVLDKSMPRIAENGSTLQYAGRKSQGKRVSNCVPYWRRHVTGSNQGVRRNDLRQVRAHDQPGWGDSDPVKLDLQNLTTVILTALGPHPEARQAVARALRSASPADAPALEGATEGAVDGPAN